MQKNTCPHQSKPDPVEIDALRQVQNKKGSLTVEVIVDWNVKPIVTWNVPDFMKYYQKKYREKYTVEFKFNRGAWKSFGFSIKSFMTKHQLTPEQYKDFIDILFAEICSFQFIPVPGFMVSEKLLQKARTIKAAPRAFPNVSAEKFELAKKQFLSKEVSVNTLDSMILKHG